MHDRTCAASMLAYSAADTVVAVSAVMCGVAWGVPPTPLGGGGGGGGMTGACAGPQHSASTAGAEDVTVCLSRRACSELKHSLATQRTTLSRPPTEHR